MASFTSTGATMSPRRSEQVILSSFIHFSMMGVLPCCRMILAELDRLDLVQATNLHDRANVGHERRLLAGLRGHLLQLADRVLVTDQRRGRLVGHVRGGLDVALLHEGC